MVEDKPQKKETDLISKTVDFIFSNKALVLICAILLFGIFLRYMAAIGVEPNADEMVHGPHVSGIISSGVIGRVWQSILWSYMTDLFQIAFGITMFTTRILSFIFGSLTILLVYLISKELFNNRKIALISAFLLAISPFHIVYTSIEMDVPVIFFILLASLFFIKGIKLNGKIPVSCAILLGIATLIKTLALFFVPVFIIGYLMYHKRKLISIPHAKEIIKFGLIILLIFSPILIHNYLWYSDSKMVDAYFAQYFDVGKSREVFSGIQGINQGFKIGELFTGSLEIIKYYFKIDLLNLLLGLSGLLLFLYKKEKFSKFFLLFQVIPFSLLVYTNRLPTHFSIFPPIFAIYSAALIYFLVEKYSKKINPYKIFAIILCIIAIFNLFTLWPYIRTESAVSSMKSYANNFEPDSIVIADSRIYRGRIAWMFFDKHYIESSYLNQLFESNQQMPGNNVGYKVYLVECVVDDCGWGTVDKEMNESVEQTIGSIKQNMRLDKSIIGRKGNLDTPENYFNVYSANVELKPGVISLIDSTHNWFYYPPRYTPKNQILDNYNVNGTINNLLFLIAKLIIWVSLIIALICIVLPFKILKSELN